MAYRPILYKEFYLWTVIVTCSILGSVLGSRLSDKTICMAALHNDGRLRHYDVHSIYGYSMTGPTLGLVC